MSKGVLIRERIFRASEEVLRYRGADFLEAVFDNVRTNTLRFASSRFHQGVTETDMTVYVRALKDGKIGVSSTNSLEKDSLRETVKDAIGIAGHLKREPFRVSLPEAPAGYSSIESYIEETARMTEEEKVSVLSKGFLRAKRRGVSLSGALSTYCGEVAVFNSNGIEACHPYTVAHLSVVAAKGDITGFKSALSKDISRIDARKIMEEAAIQCLLPGRPGRLKSGYYRVLLEPPAVSELLHWLSYIGFGAKSFHEGTSFLSGRLGERVTGEAVTIHDNGIDERGLSVPFDFEGVPKRRLPLIERGVAQSVAYDSFTASIDGSISTGHASYPDDAEGPLPAHIFMEGGALLRGEMLSALGDGIVINSFHYVNGLLNPRETVMTGMTRHGTFLVKGGKIKCPLSPMRFTENILKAFERIEGISSETEVFPNHSFPLSSIVAPHILIDGFNFTS